jgi:hypothetical protein
VNSITAQDKTKSTITFASTASTSWNYQCRGN